ncbi:MAG TPA: hypothetical protein VMQ52_04570 [Candidatus Saccharimonadales bacterium]|jgi:DNA polymerase-4|nr:hypothetical protein [Candidatus Saccharimonadales bacterium]
MDLPLNYNLPLTMHIDLNSCFAIIEQQANPLIRHKPVAVAAYDSPGGAVIASSYEAKALGIKLGINVREARLLSKDVIVMMPDPEKYFDAHRRFRKVLLNYTDEVTPKSVDEFIVDFRGSRAVQRGKSLTEIGLDIKQDIKQALGEYVTVNVGIATNRFLAKLAAGLHKPDGLDIITGENLREIYGGLELIDLPGINTRYRARLNVAGIYTPLQFLDTPLGVLRKQVFKSIVGLHWYLRLRGHEIDNVDFGRKSFGQQYALGQKTSDIQELSRLLMKLCEKTGRRLRGSGFIGGGIHLWLNFENRMYWSQGHKLKKDVYSTQDIFLAAQRLLNTVAIPARVTNMGVTVFNLHPANPEQLGLFDDSRLDTRSLARAADMVNDRYGEFTIVPAIMANMQDVILKRVAFGNTGDN